MVKFVSAKSEWTELPPQRTQLVRRKSMKNMKPMMKTRPRPKMAPAKYAGKVRYQGGLMAKERLEICPGVPWELGRTWST